MSYDTRAPAAWDRSATALEGPAVGWEYAFLFVHSNRWEQLVERLNDVAVEGWELVTAHELDPSLGANQILAWIRRPVEPLPPPPATGAEWYPDPSGRFDKRYWNGRAWTFHVGRVSDKSTHRDPPTAREPTPDLRQ